MFLSIPRYDIESIILDRESAGAYTLQTRPFVDLRVFAEEFARAIGADLILGDLFLRTETLYRKEIGELETLVRPKYRLQSTATQKIIDMRTLGEQPATGRIAIASPELVDRIEDVRKKGSHCFIMGVRRGFAPMTVCGDCGTVVTCERCSAPMVLHKKNNPIQKDVELNVFLCHRCGYERDTDKTCSYCGGWRLTPLGIGVAQAEESIRKRFPDARLFRLDKDIAKKHTEALAIIHEFYQTPGSILIGTEMAIPYLTEPLATVAVLSVNSLLTIPDFRMSERVFRLLLSLREKAREHFLIQTREKETPLFELATAGNIGEFLRTELEAREQLGYPPFSTLIKFTHEGRKPDGEAAMKEIETIFGSYHPVTFPSFIARVKGKYRMNALLKIPRGGWPNKELLGLIRALPPEIEVRVNPESVI
jgi:primosomal protein N' (replication factor Y)